LTSSRPFRPRIQERLRRNEVMRQIESSADAASQSVIRLFRNQRLTEKQVQNILGGLARLGELLKLEDIANTNIPPESVAEGLLPRLPISKTVQRAKQEPVYRVALNSIVQVLMLVGPVMLEWNRLKFSRTFEPPRRLVNRPNQFSEQLSAIGSSGPSAADGEYELTHRDYLLQRFHRVETGTVRMTTNLDVDLRELFVTPRVLPRPVVEDCGSGALVGPDSLMNLVSAREVFGGRRKAEGEPQQSEKKDESVSALDQVRSSARTVIVGAPGGGKSTFLEWLQLMVASGEEEFVLAGQQAIPLMLRLRQLDPLNLPRGAALIEKATASKDRMTLMPAGWVERQMRQGRVLLILDGLDETEPELRDRHVLPWLKELCREYPDCHYLVSSRPVGYPPNALRDLNFVECDLLDFDEAQVAEYTRHWCTAIRLARNEPEEEARREGDAEGQQIIDSFKDHPYISNLARNPLMLSAVCLVNYFEGGQLPKDRAVLYKLCVEGLLHHWDQRRGIHSEYKLEGKLRVCREVALAMQADDRAEYEVGDVQRIFEAVLGDEARAKKLLEHIRYRTGLLLERRPGVFAFAHLTFQEYLAAQSVYEGNRLDIGVEQLAREHADGRWAEVIALYCGMANSLGVCEMIKRLIAQPDTRALSFVLTEAYLSTKAELPDGHEIRQKVLERVAMAPGFADSLQRFPPDEVISIANESLGKNCPPDFFSEAFLWLLGKPELVNTGLITERIEGWQQMTPRQLSEAIYFLHQLCADEVLVEVAHIDGIYSSPSDEDLYLEPVKMAFIGLLNRKVSLLGSPGVDSAFIQILRVLSRRKKFQLFVSDDELASFLGLEQVDGGTSDPYLPQVRERWTEFASLALSVAKRWNNGIPSRSLPRRSLKAWAEVINRKLAEEVGGIIDPQQKAEPRNQGSEKRKTGRRR
jgi:hypothetical protein